ncbi:TadE/TadG family type IV pilus assembly protein [Rhizobium oryzicola]|uniref:Pilus assembly protein TadG-related protein n=1 Tax=Rhizobium oryzicola TaxID=1232668 RepID=A0ABT8T2Q8_9HYPH|nr:pilus assembly protein TadG-related protein [Rhizobium oryzicola]MDO1584568.1 pilus assembly protein TadG-related protein [Rhizobium oryzicola]
MELLKKLFTDRSGNFGMMTALLVVPLVGVAGLAIDVSTAVEQRSQMLNAADAAAAGVLSTKSAAVMQALQMPGDGTIGIGGPDAIRLFKAQLPSNLQAELSNVKIDINKTGNVLTSSLQFTASIPTTFMQILGQKQMTFSGMATGTYQTSAFMDFYMLLDNTPSMGLAATTDDIKLMEQSTSDGCAFACHTTDPNYQSQNTYDIAKQAGVQTRIDTVRDATQALMDQDSVKNPQTPGQYRMAVYTFGATADTAGLTQVAQISSDMTQVSKATDAVDLMTTPRNNYLNNQLTDYNTALSKMKDILGKGGTGKTSADRQKILFFVADGVQDYNNPNCTQPLSGSTRCQAPLEVSYCQKLKDNGIKIAVLYTTYLPLPEDSWWSKWIKPFTNQISPNMQACASTGYFFEVTPDQGIADAMKALFQKVVNAPRLTG